MKSVKYYISLFLTLIVIAVINADSGRIYSSDNNLSSNAISCLVQDNYGYMWIGTEYGLNRFDGYHFRKYFKDVADTTSLCDNEVNSFLVDQKGRLWVGTRKGLVLYDYANDCFVPCHFPDGITPRIQAMEQINSGEIIVGTAGYGLFVVKEGDGNIKIHWLRSFTKDNTDEFVSHLFIDDTGNIWRGSHVPNTKCYKVKNLNPQTVRKFPLSCGPMVSCVKDRQNSFLMVCMYGILRYDVPTATFMDAGYDLSALDGKVSIRHACLDNSGNLYLGTSGHGAMVIPKGQKTLQPVQCDNFDFDLASSNVNYIFEDRNHNIWISCYGKGLYQISLNPDAFSTYSFSSQNIRIGSRVSSITSGKESGDVWCTVQKSGVYHVNSNGIIDKRQKAPEGANAIYCDHKGNYWLGTEKALYSYNPYSGSNEKKADLDGWGVNCIVDDGDGNLFVSNYGKGLLILNTVTNTVATYSMNMENKKKGKLCNDWIKTMYYDSKGLLWIGCSDGISCLNVETGDFKPFGWNILLEGYQCFSLHEMDNGNMLLGTNSGLYLYDKKGGKVQLFPDSEVLQNKSIYSIVTDKRGDIWLSTANGIWQYDNVGKRFIAHVRGNGLKAKEYIIGDPVHFDDDRIVFGTNDGIVTFYPDNVRCRNMALGEVFLTGFTCNGKNLDTRNDFFELDYDDNSFVMEFSMLNYTDQDNIIFEYRINGGDWAPVMEGSNTLSFNRMSPGEYEMEVRAQNNGNYSKSVKRITIKVKTPWYASTPAFIIYVLLFVAFSVFLSKYYNRRRKEEMEEAKMRLLINATHDIRSPLTLILGPLKKLKNRLSDPESMADIDTIDRNAQRLLVLVNQILDERRIDKNQLKLHCRETDLVNFIDVVCALYQYNARQRNIKLAFEHDMQDLDVWIDRTNFDKVLVNLLSNAFKYTYDGGSITFHLTRENDNAVIRLVDTGIGLKEDKTDRLFDRFYQGENSKDFHIEGTGIGLNLCKAITTMHGGKIRAYNRTDGVKGSCFEVLLPLGNSHLKPEEIISTDDVDMENKKKRVQPTKNVRIMVVDDDPEIAMFIERELSNWYKFGLFPNGREALKALLTEPYDLVISDVIMPEMDGITLLKNIKGNPKISDIPVILLTTKAEISDRLEGLRRGADAYVAKPFNMEELHVLVDNLVDNVRRLRGKFSGAQNQDDKVEKIQIKGNDEALMERIMNALNAKLCDPDYNVEKLTEDVGISRAQLHRKMKEMTGISTGDFIRNMRLEQAARLISEGKINVTQVAFAVGFNNQSHFSTVFKKHFGMTPSEYAQKSLTSGPQ